MPSKLTWLFDLDNTLHNASPHVFPHINRSMTEYLARALKLGYDDAGRVRSDYWQRYGATLTGMMRNHGTDPGHFLKHTHQFPDLAVDAGIRRRTARHAEAAARTQAGVSNAPREYAEAVLQATGIAGEFDGLYAIEHLPLPAETPRSPLTVAS
ncbi:MAG: HAD family hydrolase [Rhodospirillales bacterium]